MTVEYEGNAGEERAGGWEAKSCGIGEWAWVLSSRISKRSSPRKI